MADGYEEEFDPASEGEEETHPLPLVKPTEARPVASPIVPIPAIPAAAPVAVATPLSEADRVIQAAIDSGTWKKQFDPTTQKHYYFHTQTKATTWDLAKELGVGQTAKKATTSSRTSAFGRSDSSSIVSPAEQPLLLKLPERYRSISADDGDGPSVQRTSDGEEEASAVGGKGDSARHGFQKLTGYQAFGSVSAAQEVTVPSIGDGRDAKDDDVAHSESASLTSEPAEAVKIHSARRADSAREGFKRALSSTGRSEAHTEDSATSNVEDPMVKRGFEKYNTFRAFGSTAEPSPAVDGNVDTVDSNRSSSGSPHEAPAAEAHAATKGTVVDRLAVPKSAASDSSSMFSTASQAIGKPKDGGASQVPPSALGGGTVAPVANTATVPVASPTAVPTLALPSGRTTTAATSSGAPQAAGVTFAPYVVPAKTADAAPDALPTTLRTATISTPVASGVGGFAPAAAAASVVDTKLVEMRETTDAVERLVRAFTHLRGMDPAEPNADRVRSAVGRSMANGTHQEGGAPAPSVRWQPTTHVRADTRTLDGEVAATRRRAEQHVLLHGDRNDVGIRRLHEDLLEASIVDCVLDMMTTDTSKRMVAASVSTRATRQPNPSASGGVQRQRPQRDEAQVQRIHETVTIEHHRKFTDPHAYRSDLRQSVALTASTLHRNEPWSPYQAFTTWRSPNGASSSAYGEGEQSLAVLAQEALNKYVLRHIMLGTLHPPLVRIMLLDLMAVCMDAAVAYFGSEDHSLPTVSMVLIRFDGSEKDLGLATQICHSLPFEGLSTTDEASSHSHADRASSSPHSVESGVKNRRVFRLEHWVCRLHLWVMVHALQETLRRAEAIDADAYHVFQCNKHGAQRRQPPSDAHHASSPSSGPLGIEDQIFIPQERRMFSLLSQDKLPTDQHRNAFDAPQGRTEDVNQQTRPPPSTALQEALLDSVAGTVREIASGLTQHPAFDPRDESAVGEMDQHQCVVETVQELLQDSDIRQAVEKRAAQKLMARALKRMEDTSKASDIREGERQRRDEQLRIIREAEDRASRMVDEIRAELARPQTRVKTV